MKKIKIFLKIILLILILASIIGVSLYEPKTLVLKEVEESINKISNETLNIKISDKQKLIYMGEKTENIIEIENFINSTELSDFLDFVYLETTAENMLFLSEILYKPTPNTENLILINKAGYIIKTFDAKIDSAEMISALREYYEIYL